MVDLIIKWSFFILLSCLIASSVIGQSILCNSSDSSKCYSIEKLKINKLSLKKLYELSDTVGAASTIFAADIDQDCIPELISLYASSNKILISDTRSKKIKKIIDVAVVETTGSSFAIGDIDLDGMPEFFILAASNSRNPNNISGRILCYNLDGSIRWISNVKINTTFGNDFIALLSLADFNQDGIPEIYTKNLIFNALTGIKILDGGMNGIGTKHDVGYVTDGLSVAGNLDDDPSDLELAAGYTIYKVKINNVNGIIGNSIIPMNISINGEFRDGLTSLGDINNDGRLDVIVACPGSIGTGMIYAYCLKSGSTQLIAKVFIQNQNTSIGAASIGDIKGNGTNSIIVVKSSKLYSFSFDGTTSLNEDWVMDCTDRSGAVGTILFDLNNDNKSEIILRDETDLRIIDGSSTTPITLLSLPCISDTGNEQPIIGDLDNSGQSKICIPCGFELSQQIGYVTVFGSSNPDSGWAPARPIWNQYAYNPLFINDDLTVPRVQKNQATFQKGKYNNFMQQESYVDSNGMVKKPAASLSGRINCVNYDINKKAYHITFDIFNRNNASAIADSNLLVSFYSDNPELGASLIGTYNSKIPINPGDSLLNLEIWITASNLNKLYLIVNSKRNSNGGFSDVDFIISECDYTDNIFQTIDLPKFDTLDVEICPGEKYVFFQSVITNVGQYYHSTNSTKNCDSLITILNLQYKQNCIPNCNNKDSSKCYTVEKFQSSNFSIEKKIQSKDLVSGNQPPLLADMDGDCIPEFIITGENYQGATSDVIYIIDSETGITKWEIVTPLIEFDLAGLAIADIDADGIPEIFIETRLTSDSLSQKLLCYRSDGKLIWVSDNKVINQNSNPNNIYGGTPALADFNEDGIPEIYVNNKIFNARSGHLLADGGSGGLGGVQMNGYYEDGLTIAAQLDDNPADLELAAGYSIYKVVLTNLNGIFGNSMIAYNIKVDNVYRDGYTTVADINSDGRLDVIVTSAGISGLLYAYTLLKGTTQLIAKVYTGSTLERIGPPFIGDINGSARPSILFTRLKTLNAFSYNGTTNFMYDWSLSTSDKSGCTGMTMFDFNNDGIEEIVYRDETTLRIIDGSTTQPKELANILCLSQTRREYPIVGDFDNSGHAKICVPCGVDPTKLLGKLTVFSSIKKVPGWAPARGVWNQYAYNPLQINDDLTVPQFQKNQAIFNNGKFNNFFVQESYVDSNGIVKKPAVSLSGRISCINYDVVTMTYSVIFDVFNRKDASQDADTNLIISFYNGDPNTNGIFIGSYHTDQFLFAGDSLLNLVYRFQIMDLKDFFMVVNTKRTSNGTFDDPDFIQLECDYTDNISRSIDIPKIEDLNASICSGDRFQFFGTTLTDSGIYEHKTYKFNGCDSVITILKLNAVDTVHSIQNVNTCDSYFWNGQNYTLSGIYNHDTLSVNGCDSSATLNLTINNSDQKNIIQSVCDSLIWNGMNLVQSGTYEDRRINISGCDSITSLQLTIHPSSSNSITQSACDHYDWNGQTYDKSGTYAYKGQSIYGCDSLITLQLTIDSIIQSNIKQTACNTYSWNNMLFSQSGTYESKALSQQGCDSITTLDLIINKSTNSTATIRSCDSYDWNGQIYTNSGSYTFLTQNTAGCDSTVNLLLTIDKASSSNTNISTCDSLTWNGTIYSTSGTYTFKTQNVSGCDSIATLNLSIQKSDNISLQQQACDSYLWNGKTYTQSGLYQDKSQNVNGCDSIINLNLIINKSSNVNVTFSVCDSLNYLGKTLNKNETYLFTLQNSVGCDSVINLDLKILSNSILDKVSTCDNYHWKVNNLDYNQSGLYSQKYINTQGCDSIYTLELNINKSVQLQEQAEVCKEYFWPVNKTLYNQSGDYVVPLKTIQGCDSILKLSLLVNPEYEKTDTVFTNQDYIWNVDHKNYSQSGTYEADFVSKDGCDSIHILLLSIENEVGIYYPNVIHPGGLNGKFTIYDNGAIEEIETLSIYDRWGELIWQKHHFNSNNIDLGWDGTFKGVNVNPGVFVWHAILKLKDGRLLQEKGDVTVVR